MLTHRFASLPLAALIALTGVGCSARSSDGGAAASADALTSSTISHRPSAMAEVPTDLAIGRSVDDVVAGETGGAPPRLLRKTTMQRDGRTFACDELVFGDASENVARGFHPKRFVCTDGTVKRDTFAVYADLAPDLPVRSFVDANGDGHVDTIVNGALQAHDENFDGKVDMLIDFAPKLETFLESEAAREWRLVAGATLKHVTRTDTNHDGRFDRETFAAEPGFEPAF